MTFYPAQRDLLRHAGGWPSPRLSPVEPVRSCPRRGRGRRLVAAAGRCPFCRRCYAASDPPLRRRTPAPPARAAPPPPPRRAPPRRRRRPRPRARGLRAVRAQDLAAKRSRSPSSSASPAIGVRHEPSSAARNARSAASRRPVARVMDRREQRRDPRVAPALLDPDRALGDGRAASRPARSAARSRDAEPAQPGHREEASPPPRRPRACAAASARCRGTPPPARSGRRCSTCARRRRLEVPTTLPGRQRRQRAAAPRDEGVARILARQQRRDGEAVGLQRRHVLHRVHRDVDRARRRAPPRSRG